MKWGNWVFNSENLTLTNKAQDYEIDLEKIHSSAAILYWIFQVLGKKWGDQETLHDLLLAFDEILEPQSNYCSFENDTKCDGGQLAREFAKNLQ